jgi:copper chaperone CopZ
MYAQAIIILLTICLLTSCSFRKQPPLSSIIPTVTSSANTTRAEVAMHTYVIEIGDVECDVCAHSVETIIGAIPGVVQVNYEAKNGNYEKGLLKIVASENANLTEKNLTELLSDNCFLFRSIRKV